MPAAPISHVLVTGVSGFVGAAVARALAKSGYRVSTAATGADALKAAREERPDIVVLDLMLPGLSGYEVLNELRKREETKDVGVILLTARREEADRIRGLSLGADDYLTKPFSTQELLARIRAVLRRRVPEALDTVVEVGGLRLDPSTRRVSRQGVDLKLGPTEFRLLHFFMTHPERVHSRAQLLDRVWGDHVFIEERTVDVHVKRLREALLPARCASMIETVRGAGYRLSQQAVASAA